MRFDIVYLCYQSSRQSRLWKIPNEGLDALSFNTIHNSQVHCTSVLSVAKYFCWNLHSPPRYCHAVIFTTNNFREKNNNWPEHGGSCSLQGGRGEGDHQDREDRGSQSHSGSRYSPWANTAHYLIMFGQDWMTAWTRDRSVRAWWARQPPGEPPGS